MDFAFAATQDFDFLDSFSAALNSPIRDNAIVIPSFLGRGSIRRFVFDSDFKLTVHQYRLKEELVLRRQASAERNDFLTLYFYCNEEPAKLLADDNIIQFSRSSESAIQLTSSQLDSETRFPPGMDIYFMVIGIKGARLKNLLHGPEQHDSPICEVMQSRNTFLFMETMDAAEQEIVKLLSETRESNELNNFYFRNKVQELIFLLFSKLLKREQGVQRPIHQNDTTKLLAVRDIILGDLATLPLLQDLARRIGMSETKMKQLFKQVYGDTIYNYYQRVRMKEAARLLKQEGLSVAETGRQLGFSNLSHFSRVFEKQHGIKPKKFTLAG